MKNFKFFTAIIFASTFSSAAFAAEGVDKYSDQCKTITYPAMNKAYADIRRLAEAYILDKPGISTIMKKSYAVVGLGYNMGMTCQKNKAVVTAENQQAYEMALQAVVDDIETFLSGYKNKAASKAKAVAPKKPLSFA